MKTRHCEERVKRATKQSKLNFKTVAINAAIKAGKYALSRLGKIKKVNRKKGFNDMVTDVDKHCEKLIIAEIKKSFPGHSILAEESGRDKIKSDYSWVIDPIDGTTNYIHGFEMFCSSIALMRGDNVLVGAVYNPTRNDLFVAEMGKGAFLNSRRIRVSEIKKVNEAIIATGFPYNPEGRKQNLKYLENVLGAAQGIRRPGSAALDLCYVASGKFDGFWEFSLNPWDTAAAALILKEAGGKLTKLDGSPFSIFIPEVLASNSKIHKELINILTC